MKLDLTGQRFGKLLVMEKVDKYNREGKPSHFFGGEKLPSSNDLWYNKGDEKREAFASR